MNDEPRDILIKLISKHEISSFQDPNQFRNTLNDYFKGHFKRESRMLTESFKENIPKDLIAKKDSLPYEIISPQLVQRLVNVGFANDLAQWAVDSWALSLGVIKDDDLTSKTGILFITSNPPDADIIFDGKNIGKSPKELEGIQPGDHEVRILINGYQTWQTSVDILKGQKITVNANLIQYPKPHGDIFIDSSPQGAVILIGSQHHGTTPKHIKNLDIGVHQVSLSLTGYDIFKKNITINSSKNADLNVKLTQVVPDKPKAGQIVIDSYPSNAEIYLNSSYLGKTPSVLKGITVGMYDIKIKLRGYSDFSTVTRIDPGKNTDIFWEFKRPLPDSSRSKLKTYGTIALIAATIFFVFFGLIPGHLNPDDDKPIATTAPTQSPELNAIFLPEGGVIEDNLGAGQSKTYYFDVLNPEKIRFVRVRVEGKPLTDFDFIIGKDYVPTFKPAHYDIISNIGLQTEEYDISNPTTGRYYIVVKDTGSSGGYSIVKNIFYLG